MICDLPSRLIFNIVRDIVYYVARGGIEPPFQDYIGLTDVVEVLSLDCGCKGMKFFQITKIFHDFFSDISFIF